MTWVCTLVVTVHEFAFHWLQTMKLSPGVSVGFTHTKRSLAPREILMLVVTSQSLLKTFHNPLLERIRVTGQEGELDARVLASLYSSADRRFRKWEDNVLDSFACNYEDHLVTCRVESDITALHHQLAVDPLCWFADFAMEKHWHSSDAGYQQLQELNRIRYTDGTYIHMNLGVVAAMEELARQIQSDLQRESYSRFYTGSHRAGDALVPSLRRHVARLIVESRETEPAQRRFRGRVWRAVDGAGHGKGDKSRG